MRKAVAVLAIVVGLGLTVIPLTYSLFDRTTDGERILDRFEFLTLDGHPARYLAEAETTRTGSTELVGEAIPRFASGAGVSASELDRRFPALERAKQEVPRAYDFSVRYSKQLGAVDDKFRSVYDIPISGLPLTATPWLFVVVGVACLVAGIVALRTTGRAAIVAILALGGAMALGPLALGAFAKSADGEDVKDFASRGLTARAAGAAQEASSSLDALVKEANDHTLPYLAGREGIAERGLKQRLDRGFPSAAKFLADWEVIGPRLSRLADAVSQSVTEFKSAKKMPISFPVWLLSAAGLGMTLAAGGALFREHRSC